MSALTLAVVLSAFLIGKVVLIFLLVFLVVEIVRFLSVLGLTEEACGLKGDVFVRYRTLRVRSSGIYLATYLATLIAIVFLGFRDSVMAYDRGLPAVGVLFLGGVTTSAVFGSKAAALVKEAGGPSLAKNVDVRTLSPTLPGYLQAGSSVLAQQVSDEPGHEKGPSLSDPNYCTRCNRIEKEPSATTCPVCGQGLTTIV